MIQNNSGNARVCPGLQAPMDTNGTEWMNYSSSPFPGNSQIVSHSCEEKKSGSGQGQGDYGRV